jgi:protein-S-isoprenylcysteine O-methyltransferase Ste14
MRTLLARFRVFLGFVCAAAAFWLASPNVLSLYAGGAIAIAGEAIRVWAAGHILKGREITRSGPYRYIRHPLYAGSAIIGLGFIVASRSLVVALLVVVYLGATLTAAMRTEEAALDQKFSGEYSAYRDGTAEPVDRTFSLNRVMANREYRAMTGLVIGLLILWLRSHGTI